MDSIKQIAITGSAVTDYVGGGRKTRRGRRSAQMGGDSSDNDGHADAPVSTGKLNIVKTGGSGTMAPAAVQSAPQQPAPQQQQQQLPPQPQPQQGAGIKSKIILAPKQKTKKVILAAKHQQKLHLPHKKQHKHITRRVCLPVNVIKTKIAKTRKHIKESQSMSIDKIRKELIASKLLNPASKAPDALLRKIYADVKIIGTN
jgi:hypothetical protein